MTNRFSIALASAAVAALATAAVAGCSSSDASSNVTQSGDGTASTLRLGYFPNVTHAVPVLGVEQGRYAKALGKTKLETQTFNAGPAATQALLSGAIDAVYVGPNPAINAYSKSNGEAVRVIAGGASGGAGLVVSDKINSVNDLAGKTIATPQLGGTQDIAAKYYLKQQGFTVNGSGAKNVTIVAQDNAQTLDLFKQGRIDGGWLPEPWLTRLVAQGDGHVLVDEKTLWPGGQFVTTNLLVSTKFLKQYPQTVKELLAGQVDTADWINANKTEAATDLDAALKKLTGKSLPKGVAATALANVTLGWDPYASSLQTVADHAVDVNLLKKTDLKGIYDLTLLNEVLKAKGKPAVSDAGLGQK